MHSQLNFVLLLCGFEYVIFQCTDELSYLYNIYYTFSNIKLTKADNYIKLTKLIYYFSFLFLRIYTGVY